MNEVLRIVHCVILSPFDTLLRPLQKGVVGDVLVHNFHVFVLSEHKYLKVKKN